MGVTELETAPESQQFVEVASPRSIFDTTQNIAPGLRRLLEVYERLSDEERTALESIAAGMVARRSTMANQGSR